MGALAPHLGADMRDRGVGARHRARRLHLLKRSLDHRAILGWQFLDAIVQEHDLTQALVGNPGDAQRLGCRLHRPPVTLCLDREPFARGLLRRQIIRQTDRAIAGRHIGLLAIGALGFLMLLLSSRIARPDQLCQRIDAEPAGLHGGDLSRRAVLQHAIGAQHGGQAETVAPRCFCCGCLRHVHPARRIKRLLADIALLQSFGLVCVERGHCPTSGGFQPVLSLSSSNVSQVSRTVVPPSFGTSNFPLLSEPSTNLLYELACRTKSRWARLSCSLASRRKGRRPRQIIALPQPSRPPCSRRRAWILCFRAGVRVAAWGKPPWSATALYCWKALSTAS